MILFFGKKRWESLFGLQPWLIDEDLQEIGECKYFAIDRSYDPLTLQALMNIFAAFQL